MGGGLQELHRAAHGVDDGRAVRPVVTKRGKRRRWPKKKSVTAPVGPGDSLVSSGWSRETGGGAGVLDSSVQPLSSSAGSSTAVPAVEGISPVCLAAASMASELLGPTWRCGTCTLDNMSKRFDLR